MNQSSREAVVIPTSAGMALWKRILLGSVLVLVAVGILGFFLITSFGVIVGEEFSSDRFRRRSYHYFEIPIVHFQLTPLERTNRTNDLETHLIQKKLVAPRNQSSPRWDLVTLERGGRPEPPGDAVILCRYLDLKDEEGKLIWLAWSEEQPQAAKVLWPAVADAARRGLYVLVPDLIHLAERTTDPVQLQQQIARLLARRYEQFARVEQRLNRHDRAKALVAASRNYLKTQRLNEGN